MGHPEDKSSDPHAGLRPLQVALYSVPGFRGGRLLFERCPESVFRHIDNMISFAALLWFF